ncbi:MAG: hypothetical protein IKU47_03875 [Oscillospiraceae bacterium]|nr:hypothetical protein [Oscillospiraceae bacterium]
MTQTALYSDKKLFLSLYKSALRRIRGMGIIYGLLSFIAFPMFFVMEAVEEMHRMQIIDGYGNSMRYFNGMPAIYTNASMILYFALIIAGAVIMSVYVNNYMHSKKAVDVFHALPVKRPQMLMANFAAVLTVLLGVQFVCYGVVAAVNEVTIDQITLLILFEMLRVALLTTLVAAITFFCCVCCNTSLDSAIFSGAFLAIVPSYAMLLILLMGEYVVGYDGADHVLYPSLKFSPAVMFYQVFSDGDITQGPLLNAIYAVAVVAIMVVSCILYTNRKSEMAQSASTKNLLYQFILLAASVGGGALFGFGYQGIFGWGIESIVVVIFTSCIFTVAIYLVFNAIVSRNPKPTKRGLAGLGVSLAVTVAFLLCVDNGFFGYEKRIPAMEDIESVSINYAGDYSEISNVEVRNRNNGTDVYYYYNGNGNVTFTKTEEVEMVRDIHSTIVDSIDQSGIECYYGNTYITYNLKNGKQLIRRYRDDVPMAIRRKLAQLEDLESFKKQLYPVFKAGADTVKAFDIKDGYGRNEQRIRLDAQDTEKLYSAIAQDTLNTTRQMKDQHSGPVLARIEIIYKDDAEVIERYLNSRAGAEPKDGEVLIPQVETATAPYYNIEKEDVYPLFHNVIFDVTEDCINTIAALKELGYEEYTTLTVPEDMVAYVQYLYYPMDGSHNDIYWQTNRYFDQYVFYDNMRWNENERTEEFSDPQQLRELSAAGRTTLYGAGQDKVFYMVLFCEKGTDFKYTESDDAQYMAYYITGEDVPDFVQFEDLNRDYAEKVGYTKEIPQ